MQDVETPTVRQESTTPGEKEIVPPQQQEAAPVISPVRSKRVKSKVQRKEKTPEEKEEDKEEAIDLARMPRSFPIEASVEPTPGTTNLYEPPREKAQPPAEVNVAAVRSSTVVIDLGDDDDVPPGFDIARRISVLDHETRVYRARHVEI